MIKVYVAGPYSSDNVIGVLQNIGRGQKICAELFCLGYAPFCPWHDRSYVMDMHNTEFKVKDFWDHSMAWLKVSDAVLMTGDWKKSKGCLRENAKADQLGIPVFTTIWQLEEHYRLRRET